MQGNHPTPLVLGAYGGKAGSLTDALSAPPGGGGGGQIGGLGFRELRYNDARQLLETAEQALVGAEETRRTAAALHYVGGGAPGAAAPPLPPDVAAAAALQMQNLPQEEYVLVPTRALAAGGGGLNFPLVVDVPVLANGKSAAAAASPSAQVLYGGGGGGDGTGGVGQHLYTGMREKPGFSRDGWGVSHYSVGRFPLQAGGSSKGGAGKKTKGKGGAGRKARKAAAGKKAGAPAAAQKLPAAA